jgi:hypothetical protein
MNLSKTRIFLQRKQADGTYAMEVSVRSYILRIYRLDPKRPNRLVGLAEEVGVDEKKAFTNLQELWDILRSVERKSAVEGDMRKKVPKKRRKAFEAGMKRKGDKAGQNAPDPSGAEGRGGKAVRSKTKKEVDHVQET